MKIGLSNDFTTDGPTKLLDGFNSYTKGLSQAFAKRNDIDIINCSITRPIQGIWLKNANEIEKQIDLYHAMNHIFPKFKNKPIVATVHDAAMFRHRKLCNPRLRHLKNYLLKITAKRADHYITISEAMIPELVTYWKIPEKKISVVYQGIDESWLKQAEFSQKMAVKEHYHLPDNYFLFVGRFQPRKNLINLINAYFRLSETQRKNCHLILVGDFLWFCPKIAAYLNQAIQSTYVHHLSNVPSNDLRIIYQLAKALCFPSLYEGFGLPILEAFASNTPLITSKISACPEIAGDAALIVDPYSVDEIHQAMLDLLNDELLCKELVAKGRQRLKHFSWEKCANDTAEIYKKLL